MKRTLISAVIVCSALVLSLSAVLTTPAPASAALRASLPSGWVQIAYNDAQVAVPRSFSVVYPNEQYCGVFTTTGTIFLGAVAMPQVCLDNQSPAANVTVVYLRPQHFSPGSLQGYKSIRQDGLVLYLVTVNGEPGYYSPTLGMEVAAIGPDALGVLGTFAPSPRASYSRPVRHRRCPPRGGQSASTTSLSRCRPDGASSGPSMQWVLASFVRSPA